MSAVLLSYLAKGESDMDRLEATLSILEYSLNTRKRRHIAGGILMSVSLLFGGLAVTVITLKIEEANNELYLE